MKAPILPPRLFERILSLWNPEEIHLFGSRARGEAAPASDWDLLVVVPDETPEPLLDLGYAWRMVGDLLIPADILPIRRSEYEEERRHFGSLPQIVNAEGMRIYER